MKIFAETIKLAAKIREDSFDKGKANDIEVSGSPYKDFLSCYTKTAYDSAEEASEKMGYGKQAAMPIYLLLKYGWNDILSWADGFTKQGG